MSVKLQLAVFVLSLRLFDILRCHLKAQFLIGTASAQLHTRPLASSEANLAIQR